MATENRRRLRDSRDTSDPLSTGARKRLLDSSVRAERVEHEVSSERSLRPGSRPSIRPSAFGIPRNRSSDPAQVTTAVERLSSPAARNSSAPPATSEPPRTSQAVRKPAETRPAVKTDIEELLPISQGVKSLPRPPKLPTFEAPQLPAPTTRRFPWMSLSIFAVVLGASLAPLVRYRGERNIGVVTHELSSAREVDWSSLEPLAQGERSLWGRDQLLDDGERALNASDPLVAQHAFAQALSFAVDDPSAAFGMARVRLALDDLAGARGWAESALRRRPQDARYRAFLDRLGSARRAR